MSGPAPVVMQIANENDELETFGTLPMVHCDDLGENFDEAGEYMEGKPQYRAPGGKRFYGSGRQPDPTGAYQRGGAVMNVALYSRSGPRVNSVMICDAATCQACFPVDAIPGPGTSRGLPFVHANNLHRTPPPNSMPVLPGIPFWREDASGPIQDVVVTSSEKRLVYFEHDVGGGGMLRIATAVCIPEDCPSCSRFAASDSDSDSDASMNDVDWPRPPPVNGDCDMYGVNDSRINIQTGVFEYLCMWTGYPPEEATWEPVGNIINIGEGRGDPEWIRTYHEDWPDYPRPSVELAREHGIEHLVNRP